jgi:hypothetical protein
MLVSQPPTILSFGLASRVAEIFQLEFPSRFWIYTYPDVLTVLACLTIGDPQDNKLGFVQCEKGLIDSR